MRAVILAAGRGTRLGLPDDRPKCLLEIGGETLLARYVRALASAGCPATIVVGHGADAVRERLAALGPAARDVTTVMNDDYRLGSIVSLACGLQGLDDDLLLLDGDVLFHPDLLRRIATTRHANALLVDRDSLFTTEEYMAGIDGGRVTALQRGPVPGHQASGEWVGFARLDAATGRALRHAIGTAIARGETAGGYEDALASLLPSVDMRVEMVDRPWIEIDFPGDVDRAADLVRIGFL